MHRKARAHRGEHELPAARERGLLLRASAARLGVLLRTLGLQPSSKGERLLFTNNDLRVIDGPFLESKELIGGFAVMELSGLDEAIELCRNYAEILGGKLEIDLRLVAEGEEAV